MRLLDRLEPALERSLRQRFFGLRWPVVRALGRLGLRRKLLNYALAELELKLRSRRLWAKPYWLIVDPNSGCDLRCPLCPTGKGKGTRSRNLMSWEHYTRLMDELGPTLLHVEFSNWGEPLLNPRIYDMIRYAKRYGVEVHLSSHFNRFDEAKAEKLLDSGLDWMILSIDGATAQTYSQYRVGGDFDTVVRNVRTLVEAKRRRGSAKPYVIWQFLVFRHNEHELDEVKALGKSLGVDDVGISAAAIGIPEMVPRGPGAYLYPERTTQVAQELTNAEDYAANRRKELPLCVWPWLGSVVNSNGSVSPCCGIEDEKDDYGDAFKSSFGRLWNGKDYRLGRRFVASGRRGRSSNTCTECRYIGKSNFKIPGWWTGASMGTVPLEDLFRPLPWIGPETPVPFRLRRLLSPSYLRGRAKEIRSWDEIQSRLTALLRYAGGLLRNRAWEVRGWPRGAYFALERRYYELRGRVMASTRRRQDFRLRLLLNPLYAACRLAELRELGAGELRRRCRDLVRYCRLRV